MKKNAYKSLNLLHKVLMFQDIFELYLPYY
jgi:hypothetical protein